MTVANSRTNKNPQDMGWHASLDLELIKKGGRSVVGRSRQQGPLTLQKPFYPEKDEAVCHIYLIHPPAGIVGGDTLQLNVTADEGGAALMTTPGATKFYRSNCRFARQKQDFAIAAGSSLEWLPQETIYYPDAYAQLHTRIDLRQDGIFIGWDIHCLGLPANNKDLAGGQVDIRLSVHRRGKPLFIDALSVTEEKRRFNAAFLRNQPIFGSFIATHCDTRMLAMIRDNITKHCRGLWGVTLIDNLLVLRYLGPSVNEAKNIFIRAWQLVRPSVLGRESKQPRIWAT